MSSRSSMRPASPSIRAQLRRSSAAQVRKTSATAPANVMATRRRVLDRPRGVPARLEAGLHGERRPATEPALDHVRHVPAVIAQHAASRHRGIEAPVVVSARPAAAGLGAERVPGHARGPADLARAQEVARRGARWARDASCGRCGARSRDARARSATAASSSGRPHERLLAEHVHARARARPRIRGAWLDGGVQMSTKSRRAAPSRDSTESNQRAAGRRSAPTARRVGRVSLTATMSTSRRSSQPGRWPWTATLPRPMIPPLTGPCATGPFSRARAGAARRSGPRRGWRGRRGPGPR